MTTQDSSKKLDTKVGKPKGQRDMCGWLVLNDGTQYLSAQHSIFWNKYSHGSQGFQALACCAVAVATSKLEDVCEWTASSLERIIDEGYKLHQDSFQNFDPEKIQTLTAQQVLRKFFTPSGCVYRVMVYQPKQKGDANKDLYSQLIKFFGQDRAGVLVAGAGEEAVALFKTNLGYYMFDPVDRDRYGRSIAPLYRGLGKACLSLYPSVQPLAEKLAKNIAPITFSDDPKKEVRNRAKSAKLSKRGGSAQSSSRIRDLWNAREEVY